MKTIGILGGLGPEATVDYYKEIIKSVNERNNDGSLTYPEIVIYSVNMGRFIGLLENEKHEVASNYLATCINKMAHAEVDFAAMSANTPHLLFDEIQRKVSIPLISIVDSCARKALTLGLERPGLIGTKFTMMGGFYPKAFSKFGMEMITPHPGEQEIINEKLFKELELGIFKDETKDLLLGIIQQMIDRDGIDSLILGCTEFPIMFTEESYLGIPFLNTTRIHVAKIVEACYRID
jgi:aspartate racemase